jgi:hypothetical protein
MRSSRGDVKSVALTLRSSINESANTAGTRGVLRPSIEVTGRGSR